ncbi:MAG: hypothetical protein ACPL7K_07745 [Armatimonadota bacterium]|uniref:hypothetical protein n=1 Tax=Thermogutta sp. TaxID=1962930 RepID=UPI00321FA0CA
MAHMSRVICALCIIWLVVVSFIAYSESLSRAQLQARYAASAEICGKELDQIAKFHIRYLSANGIAAIDYLEAVEVASRETGHLRDYLEHCRKAVRQQWDTGAFQGDQQGGQK